MLELVLVVIAVLALSEPTVSIVFALAAVGISAWKQTKLRQRLQDLAELNTKQFELGYAPRWGNDKFRIGPSFVYERLDVDFKLSNLTPGALPPIVRDVNVPNNVVLIGADFDFTPVHKIDAYGHLGAVPCCGGGWHVFESEFGTKYYFTHHLSIMGGVRYSYLKRDFGIPATDIPGSTVGPFSGYVKFPGIGPFVGISGRF